MNGTVETKLKLLADSTVTGLVTTYLSKPAIFSKPVIPEKVKGAAISIYRSLPTDGGLDFGNYGVTVNCYAKTFKKAEDMQDAVFSALNRHSQGDDTFFVASKTLILQPASIGGGDYNAPVEVTVKQR